MYDFIRISSAVPKISVANPKENTERIISLLNEVKKENTDIVVFPELCITGYTCGDLFFQKSLTDSALEELKVITQKSKNFPFIIIVGLPVSIDDSLYNCAAVISNGLVYGLIPKAFIPNHGEFCEKRWFSSSYELDVIEISSKTLLFDDEYKIPIGADLVFDIGEFKFGAEVCEDLWAPVPPSTYLALGGAQIIFNISASNEAVGKRDYRKNLVTGQSSSSICAYMCTSAGYGESTTDLVFSGHTIIAENGRVVAENNQKYDHDYTLTKDVDLGKIKAERKKNTSFRDCAYYCDASKKIRTIFLPVNEIKGDGKLANIEKSPFIPKNKDERLKRCDEIFKMQVSGLKKRLETAGMAKPVVGVSGGLDSTLALLVSVQAADELGFKRSDVHGITLPCFGTSDRTYQNAVALMKELGISTKEINIKEACAKHFEDIDHDINVHDLTYENAQARERTQVLMDYAGKVSGLVVGTGDLSELALGWCTYNADHMSMYGVNSGVPKTLIKYMLEAISENDTFKNCSEILKDIADTPISPELIPPDSEGKISQETENLVGPYELHDFFIYYALRYGFEPEKIFALALKAFEGDYDKETILKWLKNFYKRFFTQQFKRSCIPDGVKIGSVGLSPRGDWKMPSDASSKIWLNSIDKL